MKGITLRLILTGLMVLLLPSLSPAQSRETMLAANSTVVEIITDNGHGSGVILTDHCVITAEHVIDKAAFVKAKTADDTFVSLLVYKVSKDPDLAYLCSTTDTFQHVAHWAKSYPLQYEPVFVVGYPIHGEQIITTGLMQKDDVVTAQCAPGNSGGGAFDASGGLIGIAEAIMYTEDKKQHDLFTHLCDITPMGVIQTWLENNNGKA